MDRANYIQRPHNPNRYQDKNQPQHHPQSRPFVPRSSQTARDINSIFTSIKKLNQEISDLKFRYSKTEQEFYTQAIGKILDIKLVTGDELTCTLLAADKFCLYVKNVQKDSTSFNEEFLVNKSAIAFLKISQG
jgi:hypothetical protein